MSGLTLNSTPRQALLLTLIMVAAALSPLLAAAEAEQSGWVDPGGVVYGDLVDFDGPTMGKPYLFIDGEEPVWSATRFMKFAWADAGYPDLFLPFAPGNVAPMSSRSNHCVPYQQGQSLTVPISGGQIAVTVEKVTSTAAFLVEDSQTIPSSTLNNFASTWDSTVYPVDTQYFGNAPDVDNNCQIEIIIYNIDGGGGTGGYFSPGLSGQREALYVDVADLGWGNTILAHEFQHLLHNARDPFEYAWIDEGNADMAAYLCFGATGAIIGHANAWAQAPHISVRWWNQSLADYGAGFLFMLYLASKLGGGQAIRALVADTATGGAGIENLARNPIPGSPGNIGSTMDDIFANFTIATLLDSSQNPFGLDNIDMYTGCGGGQFCTLQITDYNGAWGSTWTRLGDDLWGWGVRAYKFIQGTGAPLNVMVQASEVNFGGRLLYKDVASGTWVAEKLVFNGGMATGLVPGFGNISDEAYVIVWYESMVDDCDYTYPNCGFPGGTGTYPSATIDIYASLITQPATLNINGTRQLDRDLDGLDDTLELTLWVNSTAFWELLDIEVQAFADNVLHDTIHTQVGAGQGMPVTTSVWWTPPWDDDWELYAVLYDQLGAPIQGAAVLTLPTTLHNMAPVATGTLSSNVSQTWLPIQFNGNGYDIWGLSADNMTYSHNNSPTGYLWDFDDGGQSWLKTPNRAYTQIGEYNVTLQVTDVGGTASIAQTWSVNVTDDSDPTVKISVDGQEVVASIDILTEQRVMFSGHLTSDNVPDDYLSFDWDWGDGGSEGGIGDWEADHEWLSGLANGTAYNLTLTVSDGVHIVNKTIQVIVWNRVPRQIYDLPLVVDTLTPLTMPTVFTDDDGTIVEWRWSFDEDVNLDGGDLSMGDPFDQNSSSLQNPTPAWRTPGLKNVTVTAIDNEGNSSAVVIQVTVNNQRPVALFARPDDGDTNTVYDFRSSSFDPDGVSGLMTTIWTLSDMNTTIVNQTSVIHTFVEPGTITAQLVVIDERGLSSLLKQYTFEISNPLPEPQMTIYEARDVNTGEAILGPSADESLFTWRHVFTDDGGIFVAPGNWLRFNSTGSRDGDAAFDGGFVPLEETDPNWNGIVEYTWDFGDGSPLLNTPHAWHAFETPGIYTVTLTLRDGFGTGDTNQTTRKVYVAQTPEILTTYLFEEVVYAVGSHLLVGVALDHDTNYDIQAWWDDDVNVDADGDGILDNDRNSGLDSIIGPDALVYNWDSDDREDTDGDGDTRNDWQQQTDQGYLRVNWTETGDIYVVLQVCTRIDVCTQRGYPLKVRDPDEKGDSLADFSIDSLLPKAEGGGMLLGVLLILVLFLGWLVMRQPTEVEIEAEEAAAAYDISQVITEGGVLGMDHHEPPPQPAHLTKDDRRSKQSGYVRPVTSRKR
jgi:PKD repeat protein